MSADPSDAVAAFARAVAEADEPGAEACSTLSGWMSPGDGPLRLFRQAVRKQLRLEVAGEPLIHGGRAAVEGLLLREDLAGEVIRQTVWLLLMREDGWRIEAVSQHPAHAALFVAGAAPARVDWSALPGDEALRAELEARCAEGVDPDAAASMDPPLPPDRLQMWMAIRRAQSEAAEPGADPLEPPEVRALAGAGRAVATIHPLNHLYFARSGEGWVFTHSAGVRSVGELLRRHEG